MDKPLKFNFDIGVVVVLLYCITSAFGQTLMSMFDQVYNPIVLVLYSFLIAAIIFNLFNLPVLTKIIAFIKNNKKLIFLINVVTACQWIANYYSVKYIAPSTVLSLLIGVVPLTTILITRKTQLAKLSKIDWLLAILLVVLVFSMALYTIINQYEAHSKVLPYVCLSVFLSIFAGVAGAYTNIYAKLLIQNGATPSNIISFRFFLIIIVAFILLKLEGVNIAPPSQHDGWILLISSAAVVVPLYILQFGIKLTDPITVSFVTAFLPVITCFIQLFDPAIRFSWSLLLFTLLLSILIFISAIYRAIKK
jgi:drug/metabolite transporter (DMT)-like permease